MYSDCAPDYIKMTALNIPAALVVSSPTMYRLSSHSNAAHHNFAEDRPAANGCSHDFTCVLYELHLVVS